MSNESPGAVELTIEPRVRGVGHGSVRRLLPFRKRRMVGPFIFVDLMGPETFAPGTGMDVDAHPHIGLSTVTYLLRGRAVHRDSIGTVQVIDAGAANWMTAGKGVAHTERSLDEDRPADHDLFGLQTWVALPEESQDGSPTFQHSPAGDAPRETRGEASIRTIVGEGFGLRAPIVGSSPMMLVDARLHGGDLRIEPDHPERAILAMEGELHLDGRRLPSGHLAVLHRGSRPQLTGHGTAVVLGGEPVGQRHIWWNFVHSDLDAIEEAKDAWAAQRFPTVPDDHDPWVRLPPR